MELHEARFMNSRLARYVTESLPKLATRTITNSTQPNDSLPSALSYTHGLDGVNLPLDQEVIKGLLYSMMFVALIVLGLRGWQLFDAHLRHIHCTSADPRQQNYWTFDKTRMWPWLKKHVVYAPIGSKRHNREFQLSGAFNYGTLPARLHAFLLGFYVLSNIVYCCLLDYSLDNKAAVLAELRGRSGVLATANLVPLIIFAGRNNPMIKLLKVSFDTFNLFHRWIGRMVIVESFVHVMAWYANSVAAKGAGETSRSFDRSAFLQFGLLAMVALAVIMVQSLSPVRHAFYEIFLHLHQLLAFLVLLGILVHLEVANLPARSYIRAAILAWMAERLIRVIRIIYLNWSYTGGCTSITVEALPGQASRVNIQLPRHLIIRPGSHLYIYLPTVSLWMSHPFSIAWTNSESDPPTGLATLDVDPFSDPEDSRPSTPNSIEKQIISSYVKPIRPDSKAPTSVSLLIQARTGFTQHLYTKASSSRHRTLHTWGFVEGPYSSHSSFASYGTVVLFAGGAGITHHLIQLRHLMNCIRAGTVATHRITLVWSVRSLENLSWVRSWMDEILTMPGRREHLKVLMYVTRPEDRMVGNYVSGSEGVIVHAGRVDVGGVLDKAMDERVGAVMVSVCGPGVFADEVRLKVRERLERGVIDLNEESFTW